MPVDLKAREYYINRELSWLEFNDRVLREGLDEDVPLMERLKFLAIVSSNLDEFFMIRVAGLMQQRAAGLRRRDPSGMTPNQQIQAISARAHRLVAEQADGIRRALTELAENGMRVLDQADWTVEHRRFLQAYFRAELLPVLTPLAIGDLDPCPLLQALQLNVAVRVRLGGASGSGRSDRAGAKGGGAPPSGTEPRETILAIPVPQQLPRFITIPDPAEILLARLEDVIAANAGSGSGAPSLLPDCTVLASAVFRLTRDADVEIQEDEAGDLLQAVEQAVRERRRRAPVRLEVAADSDPDLKKWLVKWAGVADEDVYESSELLDAASLTQLTSRPGFASLREPEWPPQEPADLPRGEKVFEQVDRGDILLFHPYESFSPVVRLLEQAADDPGVLAIKMTLYRTSGDSPIVSALERAAQNGKQVTALVELKARFDEARNVGWARRLEDAGCHVIYGIVGLKTHCKALLVVRRSATRVQRYVHLATGNYNDKTARLYSDIGLLSADHAMTLDASSLFNLLVGVSEPVGWTHLTIAPTELRKRFIELIDREVDASTLDRPGLIMAKVNSLEDPAICRALYRANQAGVEVRLNVRGICCLRPGIEGVSAGIEVRSIIDRYLEHARIFRFRNGGHEEVYLSSADWMRRNLDRRVELLFPVRDARLKRRLIGILETFFADNVKARILQADGSYRRARVDGPPVRAQEVFYHQAVAAAPKAPDRFQPIIRTSP